MGAVAGAGVEPCNIADLVSTLDLDAADIPHDAILRIGDFQPDVDLRVMRVGDPPRDDVNARVSFFIHAPDQQQECPLVIRWDPFSHERSCTEFGSSFVTVSCIAESAGECDTWFVDATHQDANGNGQVDLGERSMACVELSGGGGGPYEFYSMPFTATVTAD